MNAKYLFEVDADGIRSDLQVANMADVPEIFLLMEYQLNKLKKEYLDARLDE